MPLDTDAPVYTEDEKAMWDTMAEFVRRHSAKDVLNALSDAYLHHDEPGTDSKLMMSIGCALEKVCADHTREIA